MEIPLPLPSSPHEPPPLMAAAAVCRTKSAIEALPHAVKCISGFLDFAAPEFWTHDSPDINPYFKAYLSTKGLVAALKNDNLEVIRWLCLEYCPLMLPMKGIEEAIKSGNMRDVAEKSCLEILKWILPEIESRQLVCQLFTIAAKFRRVEIFKWLVARYIPYQSADHQATPTTHVVTGLPHAGHLGIWIDAFAGAGLLDIIQWLQENCNDGELPSSAMNRAAGNGHLHIVEWLHQKGLDSCSKVSMDSAAENGHLEVAQWLHANRLEGCTTDAMDEALSLEMV